MSIIFSVDAERNGLHDWSSVDGMSGQFFWLGVTVRKDGQEVDRFEARCPIVGTVNDFVRENILPLAEAVPMTHDTEHVMLESFYEFYQKHAMRFGPAPWDSSMEIWTNRDDVTVIAHCGAPVESDLFSAMKAENMERFFHNPLPLQEVGTLLLAVGENPTSVDAYMEKFGLTSEFDGSAHHPLYDAVVAAQVWEHAFGRISVKTE